MVQWLLGHLVYGALFTWLNAFSPLLFGALLTGSWQLLVIFGLHWGVIPIGFLQFSELGRSTLFAQVTLSTFSIFGMLIAIAIRSKERKTKELSASSIVPALFGITEPAIYGLMLPMKKLFAIAIALNIIFGAYTGMVGLEQFTLGGLGIFALPTFIHPTEGITMNFWHAIIGMAGLALAGFIVTMLIDIPKIQDEDDEGLETVPSGAKEITPETNKETTKQEIEESAKQDIVASPLAGEIVKQDEIEDEVFASGAMGKAIAINPTDGVIYAPANAKVTTIFPNRACGRFNY